VWAFVGVVVFHLATWLLFPSIGIFPLAMIVVTLIFFDPDWPRRLRKSWLLPWIGRAFQERAASRYVASWLGGKRKKGPGRPGPFVAARQVV
jgi:hypothetical protein